MNYMGNSGRNTHNDMNRGFYKRPSPQRDLRFRDTVTQPEATPKLKMIPMGPMSAGYDGGNTRPRGPDGRPLPFNKYPSRTVPVPIMDYTGSMTAQAYKPGYPTEMDYLSDPFREIDPASLYFPENPNDNMNDSMDDDMFQGYGRGPLYFG